MKEFYSNPKKYQLAKGKNFNRNTANISVTGSLKGMRKNFGWENDVIVRSDNYYYNQSKPL